MPPKRQPTNEVERSSQERPRALPIQPPSGDFHSKNNSSIANSDSYNSTSTNTSASHNDNSQVDGSSHHNTTTTSSKVDIKNKRTDTVINFHLNVGNMHVQSPIQSQPSSLASGMRLAVAGLDHAIMANHVPSIAMTEGAETELLKELPFFTPVFTPAIAPNYSKTARQRRLSDGALKEFIGHPSLDTASPMEENVHCMSDGEVKPANVADRSRRIYRTMTTKPSNPFKSKAYSKQVANTKEKNESMPSGKDDNASQIQRPVSLPIQQKESVKGGRKFSVSEAITLGTPALQNILKKVGQPDHQGWLKKKGSSWNSGWNDRYLFLSGSSLYCLKNSVLEACVVKDRIQLRGVRIVVEEISTSRRSPRYGFRIDQHGQKISFRSDDEDGVKEWIGFLRKATIERDYTDPVKMSSTITTIPLADAQAITRRSTLFVPQDLGKSETPPGNIRLDNKGEECLRGTKDDFPTSPTAKQDAPPPSPWQLHVQEKTGVVGISVIRSFSMLLPQTRREAILLFLPSLVIFYLFISSGSYSCK
ncbi:unnamed protein product [Cyclocybe aegerita]|uniref:PH domain-containing protein n=1 Tax=Cyclocybe aegerita TaxID=1973307 RepID=A0A8S0VWG7_CYCAE|nr:unnamed protein product [Cyclocybe aegerita]